MKNIFMNLTGSFFFHVACSKAFFQTLGLLIWAENIPNFYNINSRQYLLVQYQ